MLTIDSNAPPPEEYSVPSTFRDPISLLLAEHYQDEDQFYPKVDRDTGFPA